jgi:hypothetical protein
MLSLQHAAPVVLVLTCRGRTLLPMSRLLLLMSRPVPLLSRLLLPPLAPPR